MKLLLDTHTFLWWLSKPDQLPTRVITTMEDKTNSTFVSVVNIWEVQIKLSIGKLKIHLSLEKMIQMLDAKAIPILPITSDHVLALARLPDIHRDPFDRVLIAQALTDGMTLLSKDPLMKQYPVNVLW